MVNMLTVDTLASPPYINGRAGAGRRVRLGARALVVAAIAATGLAAGAVLVPLLDTEASAGRGPYASPVFVLVIGWAFIGAGLFTSLHRPGNRIGPLMVAVGFAWFVSSLIGCDIAVLHTASLFGGLLWSALVIHMVLAFPSGHLQTWEERGVVLGAYAVATVLQAPPLLFAATAGLTCGRCPRNLALIEPAPAVAGALFTLQLVVATGVVGAGCAVLLRRWRHATPPQRRAMSPVVWSGGGAGLLAGLSFATALAGRDAASAAIDWAYLSLFASIPFAFLVGLVRSRVYRAEALSELVWRLGESPRPGRLREALAHALGDRALALAYWLPARACYVDAGARPVELPAAGSGRAATSIEIEGRRVAAIVHDASLCEDRQLVRAAAAAAALELDRERLDAELRARVDDLRA